MTIGPFLAPFPHRNYAKRQKHSESRPKGSGEIDPLRTFGTESVATKRRDTSLTALRLQTFRVAISI
jgi:hypothetical protein